MKKLMIVMLGLLTLVSACSDNDDEGSYGVTSGLITPKISARVTDPLNQNPFTGILEVYPCKDGTSIYYGNYINGKLTVFNGYYVILKGDVYGDNNRELHLPIGEYNMVYWGTPKYDEPIYNSPAITHPGLTNGADLAKLYFSLRPNTDGTYMPRV